MIIFLENELCMNRKIELQFSIGGEISIDIFPKGWDKSWALKYFSQDSEVDISSDLVNDEHVVFSSQLENSIFRNHNIHGSCIYAGCFQYALA